MTDVDTGAALGVRDIAERIRGGQTTAVATTRAALARVDALNPQINAFTAITRERALAEAGEVDATRAAGRDPGPLAGVPYAVKNAPGNRARPSGQLPDLRHGARATNDQRGAGEEPGACRHVAAVLGRDRAGGAPIALAMGEMFPGIGSQTWFRRACGHGLSSRWRRRFAPGLPGRSTSDSCSRSGTAA
jgi:hypothetical protein